MFDRHTDRQTARQTPLSLKAPFPLCGGLKHLTSGFVAFEHCTGTDLATATVYTASQHSSSPQAGSRDEIWQKNNLNWLFKTPIKSLQAKFKTPVVRIGAR